MNDEHAVIRVLTEYYTAFSTLDPNAVVPYFHEPAMLVAPHGMFAATTGAQLASAFKPPMDDLRSRGYGRSGLIVRDVTRLSANTVWVRGVAQRFKADGAALNRGGVSYVMQQVDDRWKIAVFIAHDAE